MFLYSVMYVQNGGDPFHAQQKTGSSDRMVREPQLAIQLPQENPWRGYSGDYRATKYQNDLGFNKYLKVY